MVIRIASFLILIWSLESLAQVREIHSMQEILEEIDKDTLVIWDIDNTTIEPEAQWGSDQHYYFIVNKYKQQGLSDQEAHRQAERIWNSAQAYIKTQAVEPATPQIIANLQKTNLVMALTARSFAIADITRQQLNSNGVDFNINAPGNLGFLRVGNNASYEEGILYQGEGNDKGKILVKFLQQINLKPKKIVFIDDKEINTSNVDRALEELGIKHVEFRYGRLDKKVQSFNDFVQSEPYLELLYF